MSDTEMIEYEINDDLNESIDRNSMVKQTSINLQNSKFSQNPNKSLNINSKEKYIENNKKKLYSQNDTILKKGSQTKKKSLGKAMQYDFGKSLNKKDKIMREQYSVNNKNNCNIKTNISNNECNQKLYHAIINQNIRSEKNSHFNPNTNLSNLIIKTDSPIQNNSEVGQNSKNFKANLNTEKEEIYRVKNKYAETINYFESINNTYITNKNNCKNSIELEKNKSIGNNKTDYKTLNSNNGNTKALLNQVNSKNKKFEVKIKDYFNNLKTQKNPNLNHIPKKGEYIITKINNTIKSKENDINIKNNILNTKINQINNDENLIFKDKFDNINNYSNLKLNLEPVKNETINKLSVNNESMKQNFLTTDKNDTQIKYLLSNQFKESLNNSIRSNKSFKSNVSNFNKFIVKKSIINFDLSKQSENERSVSIGERLYRKSVAMKEIKEKQASFELFKKDMETINNCSFKPKLNEDSFMQNVKSKYATINNNTLDSIENMNDSKDFDTSYFIKRNTKLIESHKLKKELEDLKELKPSIKKSQNEINKITEKLHNEKITLQVEREKLANLYFSEIYTFTPSITNKEEPNIDNFYDRLQKWVEKRNENFKNGIMNTIYDEKTGQRLYNPSITNTIENTSHRHDRDLFSFLHEEKKLKLEKKIEIQQIGQKQLIENSNVKFSNDKTDEINRLLKEDCYNNLFNFLDHNNDGVIECNEEFIINAEEKLNQNILELLKPIFIELKEHEESLSKEEFFLALDELFKVLNIVQRRTILDWYVELKRADSIRNKKMNSEKTEFTYMPNVSDRSTNIFNYSTRHSKNFIDRNYDLINNRTIFREEQSKEKLHKELESI